LLTCKQFLQELNAYLDDELDPQLRAELKQHVSECPNCWVVCDTTEKTVKIYKGMEPQPLPPSVQTRLSEYLSRHCQKKKKDAEAKARAENPASPQGF
jgi:anti-sigma factor RsiW